MRRMGDEVLVYEALRPTFLLSSKLHARYELSDSELVVHHLQVQGQDERRYGLSTLRRLRLRNRGTLYQCHALFDGRTETIEWRSGSRPEPYTRFVTALARHAPAVRGGSWFWLLLTGPMVIAGVWAVVFRLTRGGDFEITGFGFLAVVAFICWASLPRRCDPQHLPPRLLPSRPNAR